MWTFVALAAVVTGLAGLISIIVPLRFVGIKSRLRGLGVLGASFVALIIAAVQLAPENNRAGAGSTAPTSPAQSVAAAPAEVRPYDQDNFIKITERARDDYRAADTEFKKGATRPARAKTLCQSKGNKDVNNWIGKVTTLTTNGDGKGVIEVRISDHVTLKTWNNSLSDIADNTLVEPGSNVFSQLGELRQGDKVKFSGRFSSSRTDCFQESSMTLHGSMSDPGFILRFRSVEKL
jgi:hypothetical protein